MPPAGTAVVGLDIGTSAVKGLLLGPGCRVVARASRRHPLEVRPGGHVTADASVVVRRAHEVIAALATSAAREGCTVRAICAGGSGDEAAWVDRALVPVAPVPMSLDARSEADGEALAAAAGERWATTTGLPMAGAYPLARLRWLRRTDPEAAARVERLLAWPELIAASLGVAPGAEPTLAARAGGWDLATGAWDAALLEAAGATADLFPPFVATGADLGPVPAAVARALGLAPGARVVAGGFDQAMATLGALVTGPRIAHVGAGSWDAVSALSATLPDLETLVPRGFTVGPSIAAAGAWSVMGSGIGGTAVAWLGALHRAGDRPAPGSPGRRAATLAATTPDAPSGLLVVPDLDGAAPPRPDRDRRAIVAGLGIGHGPADLALALLEGVASDLAARLDALDAAGVPTEEVRLTGGGSRGARWVRLRADVTGRVVRRVTPNDAGTSAAAALAAVVVGLAPDPGTALRSFVRLGRPVAPRPERHAAYRELAARRAALADAVERALRGGPGAA